MKCAKDIHGLYHLAMLNIIIQLIHGAHSVRISKYKREKLCSEILTKYQYFGVPSPIRRPDFLKSQEHPKSKWTRTQYILSAIWLCNRSVRHTTQKVSRITFFIMEIPRRQAWDQLKKDLCEKDWIALSIIISCSI